MCPLRHSNGHRRYVSFSKDGRTSSEFLYQEIEREIENLNPWPYLFRFLWFRNWYRLSCVQFYCYYRFPARVKPHTLHEAISPMFSGEERKRTAPYAGEIESVSFEVAAA